MRAWFFILLFNIMTMQASAFPDRQWRYLDAHHVVRKLQILFPSLRENIYSCSVDPVEFASGGFASPIDGDFMNTTPGGAFMSWYQSCLDWILVSGDSELGPSFSAAGILAKMELRRDWLGPLFEPFRLAFTTKTPMTITEQQWRDFINLLSVKILGPNEVVQDYGYINGSEDVLRVLNRDFSKGPWVVEASTFDGEFRRIIRGLLSREEFLSY